MSIPYHTHDFILPVATKEDVQQGIRDDLAVAPSSLGDAAIANHSDFATAEQGAKADNAIQAHSIGSLATKDKISVSDIQAEGIANTTSYLNGAGEWAVPEQEYYKIRISAGEGLQASYINDCEIKVTISQDLKDEIEQFDLKSQQSSTTIAEILYNYEKGLDIPELNSELLSLSIDLKMIHQLIQKRLDDILVGGIFERYDDSSRTNKQWFPCAPIIKGANIVPLKNYPVFSEYIAHNGNENYIGEFHNDKDFFNVRPYANYLLGTANYRHWMYVGEPITEDNTR